MKNNFYVVDFPENCTVEQAFGEYKNDIEVVINDVHIPQDQWQTTYIQKQDVILVFLVPKGGGGGGSNKTIRTVIMIAIVAAAMAVQPALAAYFASVLGSQIAGYFVAGLVLTAGVMAASYLLYQIFPDPKPQMPEVGSGPGGAEQSSLSASRNTPAPYKPLPKMYGIMRIKPTLAATPDINIIDNTQIISSLYFLNHGPIAIRLGNTEYYIGNSSYLVRRDETSYSPDTNCASIAEFHSLNNLDNVGYDNQPFIRISETSIQALKNTDNHFRLVIGTPRAILNRYKELNSDKVLEEINYPFNPYDMSNTIVLNRDIHYSTRNYYIDIPKNQRSQIYDLHLANIKQWKQVVFRIDYKIEGDNTIYHFPAFIFNNDKTYKNPVITGNYDPLVVQYFTDYEINLAKNWIQNNDIVNLYKLVSYTNPLFGISYVGMYDDNGWLKTPICNIYHLPDKTKKITTLILSSIGDFLDAGRSRIAKLVGYSPSNYRGGVLTNSSAVNPYSVEIHMYADNGLYGVDSNNNTKTLKIPFRIDAWIEGYPNSKISTVIDMEGNSKNPVRKTINIPYTGDDAITIEKLKYQAGVYDLTNKRVEFQIYVDDSFSYVGAEYHSSTVVARFIETTQNFPRVKEIRKANGQIEQVPYYVIGGLNTNTDILDHSVIMWLQLSSANTLKGSIDNVDICFGGLIEDKLNPYNTSSGLIYPYTLTTNPAKIFCDILTHKGFVSPVPLSRIDLAELSDWNNWCHQIYNTKFTPLPPVPNRRYPSFEFSKYITDKTTILDLLKEVTAAGLAKLTFKNGKFSITRDKQGLLPVQLITPRNSWGFKAVKTLYDPPDAIRINYISKKNWELVETYVMNPTSSIITKTKDVLEVRVDIPVEEYQAQRMGMMYLATLQLRPEVFTVTMDIEAISFEIGDLVYLSYDTVAIGKSYGRVKDIKNIDNKYYIVVDEPCPIDPNKSQSLLIRTTNQTSIQFLTYTVLPNYSTHTEIAVLQNPIGTLKIGDLYTFGDTTTITLKCKVTNMQFDSNQNVTISLIEEVPQIHNIYLLDQYPTYTPLVSTEPNYKLLRTRPPKILSVDSGVFL